MSEEEPASDWAQLVCVTDSETPPFLIAKDKFTIGRALGCDISHENNKLVSGTHCYILRDDTGKVWLYDTSTNGTLLNSKIKLSKGECREIEHGDEFFVVHKKGDEAVNIGYVFQDLARLKAEEEDDSRELDQTLEYEDGPPQVDATMLDDNINRVDEEEEEGGRSAVKRRRGHDTTDSGPSSKRARADNPEEADSTSHTLTPSPNPSTTTTTTTTTDKSASAVDKTKAGMEPATQLPDKSSKTGDEEQEKEKETDGKEKREEKEGKEAGGEKEAKMGGGEGKKSDDDVFSETLTCIICQELLYDCISLQPCMHSFCAGCYSEWMAHSTECPSCRGKVDRVNKNHIVNNLVEAYLKEHPEKRRPEEDRKELDAKNKITRDMLYPQRQRSRSSSDYENSDDPQDEDEDDDDDPPPAPAPAPAGGTVFGFGTPLFGVATNAYRAVCRQCPAQGAHAPGLFGTAVSAIKGLFTGPTVTAASTTGTPAPGTSTDATPSTSGNNNNNNDNNTNNSNADQPSTSGAGPSGEADYKERDKKTMPVAPAYTCAVNQNHVLCQCCLQIFPDRRLAHNTQPDVPPQQCTICYRAFCHAYWGCRKADCNGCLAKFGDMNFGRKVLPGLILDNPHESEIFSNYLDAKKLAVRDVLVTCVERLEAGTYSCPDQVRYNMTGQTPLCFACGLRNFRSLAYQYRADIPQDQLPAEVTARSNCYWGKNCRTQVNKPNHAMRFNHICEQTRR